MNTPAAKQPILRIEANYIGPIMDLGQDLSSENQNLIYARNGTGKSFIARALRLFDRSSYSRYDPTQIADLLVSDESRQGTGSFELLEDSIPVASLKLDKNTKSATPPASTYIFHVFTEDYVDSEIRNKLEELDGEIQHEIIIGRENAELDQKVHDLETKTAEVASRREAIEDEFDNRKSKHKDDFRIAGSLGAFRNLLPGVFFSPTPYTVDSEGASLKELQSQYDTLKSLPADPKVPQALDHIEFDADTGAIHEALMKVTSPSTVGSDFKTRIETNPDFFKSGLDLLTHDPAKCPFCAQSISEKAASVIDIYVQYFEDAEARERVALNQMIGRLDANGSAIQGWINRYLLEKASFDELKTFFPSYTEKELKDPIEFLNDVSAHLIALKQCLEEKRQDLTKVIESPTCDLHLLTESLRSTIDDSNELFEQLVALASDTNSERREIQNASCKKFEGEYFEEVRDEISAIRDLEEECEALKREVAELTRSHGEKTSARDRVVSTFSTLLERFFQDKYSFDGESFKVRHKAKEMQRGSDRTLSDGEKAALAFCYFLAQTHLKVDSLEDYKRLFFVFDDPVTSMSFDYIYTISQTLKLLRINDDGEIQFGLDGNLLRPKMLILTHNNYFFNVANANNVVRSNGLFQLVPRDERASVGKSEGVCDATYITS